MRYKTYSLYFLYISCAVILSYIQFLRWIKMLLSKTRRWLCSKNPRGVSLFQEIKSTEAPGSLKLLLGLVCTFHLLFSYFNLAMRWYLEGILEFCSIQKEKKALCANSWRPVTLSFATLKAWKECNHLTSNLLTGWEHNGEKLFPSWSFYSGNSFEIVQFQATHQSCLARYRNK